jgi:ribonucleoside-triphosphate reductase (formate)
MTSEQSLVLFTTPVCASCMIMKPELVKLAQLHGFDFEIIELTIENREIFQKYGIRSAPTLVILEDGAIEEVFSGYYGPKVLEMRLRQWGVIQDVET